MGTYCTLDQRQVYNKVNIEPTTASRTDFTLGLDVALGMWMDWLKYFGKNGMKDSVYAVEIIRSNIKNDN